ncbi:MAG: hypothetical protein DELT_00804 [Desulfovibrio sp.]
MSVPETHEPAAANASDTGPNDSFGPVFGWVFLISVMFLLNYLCRAVFGPLLPGIEKEFSISHAASTRILFYLSFGYSGGMFFSGMLCSKIRPKVIIAGSLILCGLCMQLVSLAPSSFLLAAACCFTGIVAGQYFNAGMSAVRGLVAPSQWSKAVAVHEFGPNAGFILAPILAGVGLAWFGWRGTVSGLGWACLAAGVLFYIFGKGGEEKSAPVPFAEMPRFLRDKRLWLAALLIGMAIAGQFGPFSVLIMHMTEDRGLGQELAATLLSASRVASPLGALVGGWLTARYGTRRTLFFCFAVYGLSLSLMALPQFAPFVTGMFLQPAFTAMVFPALFTMLAECYPLREQPVVLGIGMPIGSFLGVGLMPSILGIFGDHLGFQTGFLCMGIAGFCCIGLLRLIPKKQR